MAVPGTNFTVEFSVTPPTHHLNEVVYVVGPWGTGGGTTVTEGSLVYGSARTAFTDTELGTDGATHYFLDQLFGQVSCDVVWYVVDATYNSTKAIAGLDYAQYSNKKPTILHAVGDITAPIQRSHRQYGSHQVVYYGCVVGLPCHC